MLKKNKMICKIQAVLVAVAISFTAFVPQMTVKAAPVEIPQAVLGIDVSRYQGQINWDMVATSGVSFALIRLGYRAQSTGVFNEDPYARYNLQEANRVGIKVGAYFASTAVTAQEVFEEATWVCNYIDAYQITYPVVFDCEGYDSKSSRQYNMSKAERTALATIFLDTVAARGYTPMFYSSKNAMENNRDWDMNTLSSKYKIWVAYYPKETFPAASCTYSGVHSMWQYTDKAYIAGINGAVDMNVAYFDYTEIAQAKAPNTAVPVTSQNITNVQYSPVLEVVTTTSAVNLRTEASTDRADTIVAKINQGDMIWRVGVGNNGWSMVKLPGSDVVYYAYTQYLKKVQ